MWVSSLTRIKRVYPSIVERNPIWTSDKYKYVVRCVCCAVLCVSCLCDYLFIIRAYYFSIFHVCREYAREGERIDDNRIFCCCCCWCHCHFLLCLMQLITHFSLILLLLFFAISIFGYIVNASAQLCNDDEVLVSVLSNLFVFHLFFSSSSLRLKSASRCSSPKSASFSLSVSVWVHAFAS